MTTKATGSTVVAYGPDPTKEYKLRFAVVPLGDLITSHTTAMARNPKFPSSLQPRLRDRAASRLQVEKIARNLKPTALLTDVQALDRGPMIVGPDLIVESGNGRAIALMLASLEFKKRYRDYKTELVRRIEARTEYRIDPNDIKSIKQPVLVRERLSKVDRAKFAAEANQAAILTMSPLEQARQDAERLTDNAMAILTVGENQSIDQALRAASNAPLVSAFTRVLPDNERAAIADAHGQLNLLGLQRLKAAVFFKVYGGDAGLRLTQAFFESIDPSIKNIENALFDSLPAMAQAEGLIRTGKRSVDLSIGDDVAATVDVLARLRGSGISVGDYIAQSALFDRDLTVEQEGILVFLDEFSRSRKAVREFLKGYAEAVQSAPHPDQGAMFAQAQSTKGEILGRIIEQKRTDFGSNKRGKPGLFDLVADRQRIEAVKAVEAPVSGPQLEKPAAREPRPTGSGTGPKRVTKRKAKKVVPKPPEGDEGVSVAEAKRRLADVTKGTRRGKRNPEIDKSVESKEVAPAIAKTAEDRRLQRRWWRWPNMMDFAGVDTPKGQRKTAKK